MTHDLPIKKSAPPNTIRVRVAVAVDGAGWVFAAGVAQSVGDEEAMTNAECDCDGIAIARAFITADIPLIPEVQAKVEGTT